jgi:hypothetical protein
MTHVKFNYSNKEYNLVLPLNTDNVQRIEIATNDNLFVVVVEMHKNLLKVYRVTEEMFEVNDLVHSQPIKKAMVRAIKFIEWFMSGEEKENIANQITGILDRYGKINLTSFDIFKGCWYIPEDICFNVVDKYEEYEVDELIFMDDYQEKPKYYML